MTIAISTKVGEGLVYAADSTSTYFETLDTTSGLQTRLVQSYHNARKLMQLERYPVAMLTFGLGTIGTRNLESLVTEFERQHLTPYDPTLPYTVEELAGALHSFLMARYTSAFPAPEPPPEGGPAPEDQRIRMGVVMGGFSAGEFYPDEWSMILPDVAPLRVRHDPAGDFGVRWWGVTDPVMRLIAGVDPGMVQYLVEQGVERSNAEGAYGDMIQRFRWNMAFDGMPVQDAIDLSVFLANVAIGHSRFVVGLALDPIWWTVSLRCLSLSTFERCRAHAAGG